ncbi:MAG: non-ribosomal peptide synthetase, partial [Pleurocapsa sp. CRU_1_2]|nr:non-ribosomal peptide synthetase [Pleurocapsa sp. CRU_1_2]
MSIDREKASARISKLSPEKRAILAKRLQGKGDSDFKTIPQRHRTAPLPLSFAQQRIWFLQQLEIDNPFYNEQIAIHLTGLLDVVSLEKSLNEMIQRHEALRTTFKMVEGQPVQIIASNLTLTLPTVNLCQLPEAQRQLEIQRAATEQSQRPFDLVNGPLLRWTLLQIGRQEYVLLFDMHHIITDGWSLGIIIRELSALYQAFSKRKPAVLSELPIQYADFAVWQREIFAGREARVSI